MKYYKYLEINTKDIAQEIKNYLLLWTTGVVLFLIKFQNTKS